ncbi:LuxR C-terminal-related transcriptional regulator [Streptomyces sp. NRRL F-5630]|uniref:LuxR C-terminal-related transcriptional regulator n=1 Tax=Streptomyces sp. NRRL F-5630 TaxID=1463864 RepID=UPI003EBB84E1
MSGPSFGRCGVRRPRSRSRTTVAPGGQATVPGPTAGTGELVATARTVAAGDGVVDPTVTPRQLAERARRYGAGATGAREPRDALTSREREALSRLGEGSGNAEIAERTGVAEGTVTPDVSQLLEKPGPRDRLQASALARDLSLQAGRPTVRPSRGRSPVRPRLLLVQTS